MIKLNDDKWSNVIGIQIFCFRFILNVFSVPEYVLRLKELSLICTNMPCRGGQIRPRCRIHFLFISTYDGMSRVFAYDSIISYYGHKNYQLSIHPLCHVPSIFPFNFSYQSSRSRMREVEQNETFLQYIYIFEEGKYFWI